MSVGVDLHKKQFTVYCKKEGQAEGGAFERYITDEGGYRQFEQKLRPFDSLCHTVLVAVESTGNTR